MNDLLPATLTTDSQELLRLARLAWHGGLNEVPAPVSALPRSAAETASILGRADREDLLSLTVRALDAARDFNSTWISSAWRERVSERKTWARFRIRLLGRIARGMQSAGLHTAVIKGPLLSQYLYGAPDLRDFHDLDLVVLPEQAYRAARWLFEEGFVPHCDIGWFKRGIFLDTLREASFTSLHGSIQIDLHWRIDQPWNPPLVSIDDAMQAQGKVTLDTGPRGPVVVPMQPPEIVLLLSAANVIGDWDCELRSLIDVAHCAQRLTVDEVRRVVERSVRYRSTGCLAAILHAAQAVTGAPESAAIRESMGVISPWTRRATLRWARHLVQSALASEGRSPGRSRRRLFMRGPPGIARYWWARMRPGLEDFQATGTTMPTITQTVARSLRRKMTLR